MDKEAGGQGRVSADNLRHLTTTTEDNARDLHYRHQ
jgi:hypothetical protein